MQAVCSVGVVYSRHFMHRHGYDGLRAQTKEIFERNSLIHCPYFGTDVVLNAEGLHHLRYSAERERTKPEQMLKFRLLQLALEVSRKSGTVQEYRKSGSQSARRVLMPCESPRRSSTGDWLPSLGRGLAKFASSCGASARGTLRSGASCAVRRFCRTAGRGLRRRTWKRIETCKSKGPPKAALRVQTSVGEDFKRIENGDSVHVSLDGTRIVYVSHLTGMCHSVLVIR